jgi:hypothetical protein
MNDDLEARALRLLAGNPHKRVEIMVTGQLSRLRVVRQSLDRLQRQLLDEAQRSGGSMQLRMTAFLDGCRHTTPWSASPIEAGNGTQRWHCLQGQTRFAEALESSYAEQARIDAIVIFGDRFDDVPMPTLEIAGRLRQRGTKIFAFHVGKNRGSRFAYDQLAERSGGISVQLTGEAGFTSVLPVITEYLFRPAEALHALPAPSDPDVKVLVDRLKLQPVPIAVRALPTPAVAPMLPPPMRRRVAAK